MAKKTRTSFRKGRKKTGGRKQGTPNKATLEIREVAQNLLSDPKYLSSLKERLIAGRAPQMETLLHHYAYGKPTERNEGGPHSSDPQTVKVVWEEDWRDTEPTVTQRLAKYQPVFNALAKASITTST